ncbi:MAG TPA: tellurite resistance/C4-dicarboxylate transporter family protein [Thermoanaerobaculia bacterium]|nr:tellurite resistance/C4-dicarboxylate transporter family protein [Thermoanaerobaculia bacterium]
MTGLREAVADLNPGYFALVMATGIVGIASHRLGYEPVAVALLLVNVVAYVMLWALTLGRLLRHPRRMAADLADHAAGPGFFTVVAGTAVLGSQVLVVAGERGFAEALWWLTCALWAGLIYAFFTVMTVRVDKPPFVEALNGAWLLAVVATQSVPVLGGLLALGEPEPDPVRTFFLLCMFLFGGMLYLLIISLIFFRFTFYDFPPEMLTPPYWINMGAVAISTLAGASLTVLAPSSDLLVPLRPFVAGLTLFFWSTATWWIPLLLILGAWRHGVRRVPLRYHPSYWGMVFPLGMYTVCTLQLAAALDAPFLVAISEGFVVLAWIAWAVTFAGMVAAIARVVMPARRQAA